VVGVLTVTAACGPSPDDAPSATAEAPLVSITGTGAEAPELIYPVPLTLDSPITEVVWEGDGDEVVELWGRQLDAVESQDFAKVDTEIDWVIKRKLFQRYQDRYNMELSDPKISQLDLAYHDIKRGRGVFDLLQRKGLAARITTDEEIEAAVNTPPQTTRAKLRGEFISAAQEAGRDFTVDWVHLKLNDQAQRTVLCKDPFRSVDERVKRLIASM
jgi:proteasome accessory factor A